MRRMLAFLALFGACAALRAGAIPPAPGGQFSDRANLIADDAARLVRIRQDFLTRASGCPLYIATFPSADGAPVRDRAAEIFTQWHAAEKRLPDDAILLVAFGAEKSGAMVLGPSVPREYEDALSTLPALSWSDTGGKGAGAAIEKLVFDMDARLETPAAALGRRRAFFLPPVPRGFVLDGSGRFSDADRARLDADLAGRAKSSGHPIVAAIDPPGLPLALGDFGGPDMDRYVAAAFGDWRRDRPELEDGAVLFLFSSRFAATISYGGRVAGRVPADVTADLTKDLSNAQTSANFDRALVRIAETLDLRFAGRKTLSVRSPLWAVLHPWRVFSGPDEDLSLAFKIFSAGLVLYFLGWLLYLVITHPKMMLFQLGGFFLGGVIGGAVSKVAGEAIGEAAGKFVGGLGGSGGGGSSGSW